MKHEYEGGGERERIQQYNIYAKYNLLSRGHSRKNLRWAMRLIDLNFVGAPRLGTVSLRMLVNYPDPKFSEQWNMDKNILLLVCSEDQIL
jgi:hypothetical protein